MDALQVVTYKKCYYFTTFRERNSKRTNITRYYYYYLIDLSRLIPSTYLKKGRGRVEKTEIVQMAIKYIQHLQQSGTGLPPKRECRFPIY